MVSRQIIIGTGSSVFSFLMGILFAIGNTSVEEGRLAVVTISTLGLEKALFSSSNYTSRDNSTSISLYGNSSQEFQDEYMPSQGLRKYYSWGLWKQCAGYKNSWIPQYCTPAKLAYPFSPTMAFLTDVPTLYKADLSDVLSGSTNGTKLNRSLSGTSNLEGKASFLGLLHIVALVPLSVASCRTPNSKPIAMWAWIVAGGAFQSMLLGAVLWTVMIIKFRSYINQVSNINSQGVPLGIEVESASGLSALWVTAITSLIANVAFGMNFLAVRRRARQLSADTDLPPSLTYTYDNRTSMSSKEGYLQTDSKQM